jgi:hypothetical protein
MRIMTDITATADGAATSAADIGLAADANLSWALGDAATVAWDDDDASENDAASTSGPEPAISGPTN